MADRAARRRERRWPIPYLDLTNTLFFFFVCLFALALLAITDTDQNKKVESTSRYLVTLKWRDASPNDIDIWLKIPNGEMVWFRRRQAAFASLDHDNLGANDAQVVDASGQTISSPARDEVIYLRETMAGTYVANVHLYGQYNGEIEPVVVTLTGVEDTSRQVIQRQLTLVDKHQENTAFRFTIDADGHITSTDTVEELFVNQTLAADK